MYSGDLGTYLTPPKLDSDIDMDINFNITLNLAINADLNLTINIDNQFKTHQHVRRPYLPLV